MMNTVIFNGMICDGSGNEPEPKDLLLKDGRIADIVPPGNLNKTDAEKIDAKGKVVAPGFIDVHAHGDTRKLHYPERKSVLLQGITTEIDGNCGDSDSCAPGESNGFRWNNLEEYAEIINELKCSVNTVVLAGHNTIRQQVMGDSSDHASAEEIKAMQHLLEKALESGAAGWSSGLTYFPGKFSDEEELKALSRVTAGTEKIYATHMRSEGDDLFNALQEAVNVAKAGSNRLQISHLKTIFPRNFHKIDRLLEMIGMERQNMDLHCDRYPYIYSSTRIGQILPAPYDKIVDIQERLRTSKEFRKELAAALKNSPRDLKTTILISENRTLAEIAEERGRTVEEIGMEMLMQDPGQTAAYLCMSEANLNRILAQPYVCAGSDGISCQLDDPAQEGHPRAVGSFPKFYRLVSQMSSVGEAVCKMTGLPATIFRIPDRGFIRKGKIADLVIFDPEKLDSFAGFSRNNLRPEGIDKVFVNGQIAWNSAAPHQIGRHGRFIAVN
ncbi:MAG: amidohydrolase family protein [Lentisphaeria bacterium]|nr:amidohydrolase family protein [Lentisphaeria bacterium]